MPTLEITPIIDAIANPPKPTDEQRVAYDAMIAFDTAGYEFPQAQRDDLSQ